MSKKNNLDDNEIILKAHRLGVKYAIDLSIRTGVPLVIEKNGKIIEVAPKYKYVRVPIKSKTKRTSLKQKKTLSD